MTCIDKIWLPGGQQSRLTATVILATLKQSAIIFTESQHSDETVLKERNS